MKPRIVFISAVVAASICAVASRLVVSGAKFGGPPPAAAKEVPAQEPSNTLGERAAKRVGLELRTRTLLEQGKWEEAIDLASELKSFDPINEVAEATMLQARAEIRALSFLDEALALLEEGEETASLERLFTVPEGTESYQRARIEAERLLPRIVQRSRGECLGLMKAGRHHDALEACSLVLDLTCGAGEEQEILQRVRWLERRVGSPQWRCPDRVGRWLQTEAPRGGSSNVEDGRLAELLERWARGESGALAVSMVIRLGEEGSVGARRVAEPLRQAEKYLQEGLSAMMEGRLDDAEARLKAAWKAEERIFGEARSARLLEARGELGRRWLQEGRVLEAKHRHEDALAAYGRGKEAAPTNVEIVRALWRLESRADRDGAGEK